jgi:hypothetical protein
MPKMVVLKPILWNPTGYMGPSGEVTSSGYADENGYGHEEWNGRDDWVWRGWRVFDTQSQPRLHDYAATGDLGIIMITVVGGRPCVVGVACNVYGNSAEEQRAIARELRLKANGAKVWALPAVQDRFGSRAAFNKHWNAAYNCVRWRCPLTHYHWMRERVHFDPNEVAPRDPPREKVVAMHSSYQSILPERALALLKDHLPRSHPILGWLSDGEFDMVEGGRKRSVASKTHGSTSAGAPVDPYTRYLQENEVLITPRHHLLQEAFAKHLKREKATAIKPNVERVDIRFTLPGRGPLFAEIKPTEPTTVRFAIRSAIGQLLDYRQKCGEEVGLLVVISEKPQDQDDLGLALDNGFGLAWQTTKGFEVRWPSAAGG